MQAGNGVSIFHELIYWNLKKPNGCIEEEIDTQSLKCIVDDRWVDRK